MHLRVTNPFIDLSREPMETRKHTSEKAAETIAIKMEILCRKTSPQLKLEVPIMFSAMSYGSMSYNAHKSLAMAAEELGILYNTGEGGLHEDFISMVPIQ